MKTCCECQYACYCTNTLILTRQSWELGKWFSEKNAEAVIHKVWYCASFLVIQCCLKFSTICARKDFAPWGPSPSTCNTAFWQTSIYDFTFPCFEITCCIGRFRPFKVTISFSLSKRTACFRNVQRRVKLVFLHPFFVMLLMPKRLGTQHSKDFHCSISKLWCQSIVIP